MLKKNSPIVIAAVAAIAAATLLSAGYLLVHGNLTFLRWPGQSAPKPQTVSTPFGWAARVQPYLGAARQGSTDGLGNTALFSDPFGLVFDRTGNLYVSDGGDNNRIRKITPQGMVSTFAGSGEGFADGTAQARFNTPSGLAIDADGNLVVADTGNNAIRKISPQGVVSTLAGDGIAGYRDGPAAQARFNGPIGVAVDQSGNVYVADTYNDRIRMITKAGVVNTLAGGDRPGYRDGAAASALFDTPCALLMDAHGRLVIADTRNDALRTLQDGQVGTLARAPEEIKGQPKPLFRRPYSLAATADGYLYVGTMAHGRIFEFAPNGDMRGLSGVDIDFPKGDNTALRLAMPSGLAVTPEGGLVAADAPHYSLRKLVPASTALPPAAPPPLHTGGANLAQPGSMPWPFKPQSGPREVVGTMGEVRGNDDGESRDHFHAGMDVQANMGTTVLAVADGKVSDPLANWGYGELSEGVSIGEMVYLHMRVGRTASDAPLDPARFTMLVDADGKPRVRVKRGTRFAVGDALGSVNRMYHTHLEYTPAGAMVNPQVLGFHGFHDRIAPHIDGIALFTQDGKKLAKLRHGRVLVPADAGDLSIVVDAYDQIDGNAARRRLGVYKIGYQILRADGASLVPVAGFEQPQINIEFNQLPPDRETVKIAYAEGSGETVHGSAATRFLYVVTNTVRDGQARTGSWHTAPLPRGAYVIRIFAADFAGNVATAGRDLPVTLE